MIKKIFLCAVCSIFYLSIMAQTFTISGNIKDLSTGEDLIGATLSVKELPGVGVASNAYGFYSLTLDAGDYTLVYEFLGYEAYEEAIQLNTNITKSVELGAGGLEIETVVVKAEKEDDNISNTKMSVNKLNPKEIEAIPVIFGERDIVKTLQLTPGVKSAGEGNSGFYVRGGGIDQNLILLDEAPVYNASHLLGFFSVFNSDALKDVTLYKGGIPAEFGGRASSVLDIKMKEGNKKHFSVSGGIGLISSRLTIESPIVKEKGSFIVSARRTYADQFLRFSSNETAKNSTLYFYDLNAKANYQLTEKDRIFLSGYFGRDNFGFNNNQFGFDWGNGTGTLRWNHLINEKLFSNTSAIYSNYNYKLNISFDESAGFSIASGIQDWNFKQDFSWFPNPNNTIKFGLNGLLHTFKPGTLEVTESNTQFIPDTIQAQKAIEGAIYIQNEQKINDKLSIFYGLRYSMFNQVGPGDINTYDSEGNVTETVNYDEWESVKYYGGLEPRFSLKYQLDDVSSVKASYNRINQYLHLLSNSATTTPTDIWIPSSKNVKPQIADQVALGYFRNFADNNYEFYIEGYYKDLQNQIDYRNGADLVLNSAVEGELVFGDGHAYGAEVYLKKRKGDLTGWISYTLGRTLRTFPDINNGEEFPARQDRIHDVAIVGIYKLAPKWTLSGTFVFYTGDAATFPSGKYNVGGIDVPYFTERNGYRFPNYHRLDLGVTWIRKKTERKESSWNLSVYNAYARENAYTISFREVEDNPNQNEAVQLALFKIIPSISYNFKF